MSKGKYKRRRQQAQQKAQKSAESVAIVENKAETAAKTTGKATNSQEPPRWKRFKEYVGGSLFTNQCIAAFTLALAAAAIYQFIIMGGQLDTMRKDQRAWVAVTVGDPQFTRDSSGNVTVSFPAVVSNSGKTPARHSSTEIVVDTVENGQAPTFAYDDVPRTWSTVGVLLPNVPLQLKAPLLHSIVKGHPEPRSLSPPEYQELLDGKDYIVIYARSSYVDIFGREHWHHFCAFNSPSAEAVQVTARGCTNYNDVDNN